MHLLCDNTSAISVAKNPVLHSRPKHIDVRFHILHDHSKKGDIDLCHIDPSDSWLTFSPNPMTSQLLHI